MTRDGTPSAKPVPRAAVAWGLGRALLSLVVLVGLYFLGPLAGLRVVPLGVTLTVAVALLVGIGVWQIRAITASPHPRLRGVEALAITVPLYILVFAGAYYAMAVQDPGNFDVEGLTRLDTLYFAVTVFSSVGFGDISAASQYARALVTVQMILNLIVLGAGIRVFVGAARRTREGLTGSSATALVDESILSCRPRSLVGDHSLRVMGRAERRNTVTRGHCCCAHAAVEIPLIQPQFSS